jgi:O-antigen/teichoic acid export membrane protein
MLRNLKRTLAQRHNVRAHFWQSLANYTQSGGGMLLGILLARLLEPSVFGEFVLVTATLAFLMIPVSFSTAQLLISDAGRTGDLLGRVLGLATLVCAVKMLILLGYITFNFWQGNFMRAGVAAITGAPLVFADYITALRCDLEGRGLFKQNFVVQILDLFAHATVAITLVLLGFGIYGLAFGGLAGFLPQAVLYFYLNGRKSLQVTWAIDQLAYQFRKGFWLWLAAIAANWYSRIDKVLLGSFGGATQLGYYNRAINYGPISHLMLNSLMTNAAVRGLSAKSSLPEKRIMFFKALFIVCLGAIATGLFWQSAAPSLVPLIFGVQWIGLIEPLQLLGWLGVPYMLASGTAIILYAEMRFRLIALVNLVGLLFLSLAFTIVGRSGALTAVNACWLLLLTTSFTGLIMTVAALKSLKHHEL